MADIRTIIKSFVEGKRSFVIVKTSLFWYFNVVKDMSRDAEDDKFTSI